MKEYFLVLSIFAGPKVDRVDRNSAVDMDKVEGLMAAGCLLGTDVSTLGSGPAYMNVTISAHGAEVLAQWKAFLDEHSYGYRLLGQLEKLAWLLAGVLLSALVTWLR